MNVIQYLLAAANTKHTTELRIPH